MCDLVNPCAGEAQMALKQLVGRLHKYPAFLYTRHGLEGLQLGLDDNLFLNHNADGSGTASRWLLEGL